MTADTTEALQERAKAKRKQFSRDGISIASWATAKGLNSNLVYEVLRGKRACIRGESHRAAVLLGIKTGDPDATAQNYDPRHVAAH